MLSYTLQRDARCYSLRLLYYTIYLDDSAHFFSCTISYHCRPLLFTFLGNYYDLMLSTVLSLQSIGFRFFYHIFLLSIVVDSFSKRFISGLGFFKNPISKYINWHDIYGSYKDVIVRSSGNICMYLRTSGFFPYRLMLIISPIFIKYWFINDTESYYVITTVTIYSGRIFTKVKVTIFIRTHWILFWALVSIC